MAWVFGVVPLTGGIGNGMVAALKGNNFWTGKDVNSDGRSSRSRTRRQGRHRR